MADSREIHIERSGDDWVGRFKAMAGPCEVWLSGGDRTLTRRLVRLAAREVWRIEAKYSRYRPDSVTSRINAKAGRSTQVDAETAALLDYADTCYRLSEGLFDITSGVLRRVWKFDGSERIPTAEQVATLMQRVGWNKVRWERPRLTLGKGMEIDFGGLGKEYAADQALALMRAETELPLMVNLGGDLVVTGPRANGEPWWVGIDDPARTGAGTRGHLALHHGAVATSGDARRFLLHQGRRYGHILDPRNGWPVEDAPRAVTVVADTCIEAGIYTTLAALHGAGAEGFLAAQGLTHQVIR